MVERGRRRRGRARRTRRIGADHAIAAAHILGVAADEHDVYFANTEIVGRVPISGGEVDELMLPSLAGSVAIDADAVYVAAQDGIYRIEK